MNDLPEKSKRKIKPGSRLRRILIGVNVVVLLLVGAWFLMEIAFVCGCSGPSDFDHTVTAISLTNDQVAVLLTETREALATAVNLTNTRVAAEAVQTEVEIEALNVRLTQAAAVRQATFDAAATASAIFEMTRQLTATPSPASYPAPNCAWVWANQDDAATAATVEAALREAQVGFLTVRVSANGEDQVCSDNGTPAKTFHLMQRSVHITLPLIGSSPDAKGAAIERVLRAMQPITIDRWNFLQINFDIDGITDSLWTMDTDAAYQALAEGTPRAALFEAGQPGIR